ncbi:MAG: agmatine deiminase family protein [Myxococcales bacterium]|nr:agmatine deiminase family protein [Myxococcales bacterium]
MRWLLALLSAIVPALSSIPTASSEPLDSAILAIPAEGAVRTLVGDWEAPDMVVVVYGDGWPETYFALLDAATAVRPVVVLSELGDGEAALASIETLAPEQRAQVWAPGYEVDSSWVRDYGPLQARASDGSVAWLDAGYSIDRSRDDDLPLALADWFGVVTEPVFDTLDGGSLASNGRGLCVSTVEYFETQEVYLAEDGGTALLQQLGCRVLALVPALAHEGTKHVDLLLQFLAPDRAVVARFDPTLDAEDARRADAAVAVLQRAAAQLGQPLSIARLESPVAQAGRYASYVNFLQLGDHLLVPGYDTVDLEVDDAALAALGRLVPDRTIVRIPADEASANGGAVHCLTWGLHTP